MGQRKNCVLMWDVYKAAHINNPKICIKTEYKYASSIKAVEEQIRTKTLVF
jgi:hypothetical protein